jgi:drug/metabolite transporter (DMT)-like permease
MAVTTAGGAAGAARGIRFVLMAVAFFAAQDGISRHLAAHYPVPFFVMIRYWFFAAFVLVLASRQMGGVRAAARTAMPLVQIARGVILVTQILVIVTSFDMIGLGSTHAIFALHPLLTTLLAIPVLGEVVGWRRLAAVAVGFVGILVILAGAGEGIVSGTLTVEGGLVALLSATMFATYSILTRMVARADGSASPAFFYTGIAGAVAVSLVGPFFWVEMTPVDWGWMAVLCVTGMSGHYFLIRALDATEAVRIQPFIYLQMVFTTIIGWIVFAEPVVATTLLGMGLIIGAGLYAIWREHVALQAARAAEGARAGPV